MSDVLCLCGCGLPISKRSPSGYRHGHHATRQHPGYTVDEQTGCWNWLGPLNCHGYPQRIRHKDGTRVMPYRLYYERKVGPVPDGKQLDHLCRNRICVNPEHLEPVTASVNVWRRPVTKLSPESVVEIRRLRGDGLFIRVIAERFGVSEATVSFILSGKTWKEVA